MKKPVPNFGFAYYRTSISEVLKEAVLCDRLCRHKKNPCVLCRIELWSEGCRTLAIFCHSIHSGFFLIIVLVIVQEVLALPEHFHPRCCC
jgi:hypothetical protein